MLRYILPEVNKIRIEEKAESKNRGTSLFDFDGGKY